MILVAQPVVVMADVLRCDAIEREAALRTGGEEAFDGSALGVAGVLVSERTVEELLDGEDAGRAGVADDGWQARRRSIVPGAEGVRDGRGPFI